MNPFESAYASSGNKNEDNGGVKKKKVSSAVLAAVIGLSPMAAKSEADRAALEKPPRVTTELTEDKIDPLETGKRLSLESPDMEDKNLFFEKEQKEQLIKDAEAYDTLLEKVKRHQENVGKHNNDLETRLEKERERIDATLPHLGGVTDVKPNDSKEVLPSMRKADVSLKNVDTVVESFRKDFGVDVALNSAEKKVSSFMDNSETLNTVTEAAGVNAMTETLNNIGQTVRETSDEQFEAAFDEAYGIAREAYEITGVNEDEQKKAMQEVASLLSDATPGKLVAALARYGVDDVLNREIGRFIIKAVENSRNITATQTGRDTRFQDGFDARHPDNMLFQKEFTIESGEKERKDTWEKEKTDDDIHIKIGADPFDVSAGITIEKKF